MKKNILCAFSFVLFANATNAQSFGIGPKVGANFSSITGIDGIKSKTGSYFGVFAEIGVSDKFSLQPEVLYTSQGGVLNNEDIVNNYISVPVMFKYRLFAGLAVEVGPKFDFLSNSKIKVTHFKGDFNSFNFGVGAGLSYRLPLGLSIDARYNFGLSNLNKNISIDGIPSSGQNLKNDVFQIGVGYRFL